MKVPEKEILEGDILKIIFVLGWPTMVLQILQVAYNMADTFWLGRWSSGEKAQSAVAAMQISWPVIFVMISIGAGFGVAAISLISQYTGAGKVEKASHATGQLITIAILLALTLSAAGILLTPYLLNVMSLESRVEVYSIQYMRIIFLGLPFVFLSYMFMAVFRAFGSPLIPMYVNGFGVVVNIAMDPVLINGYFGFPSLGVYGAAIATIISRALTTAISLYIVHRGVAGLKVYLRHLKPSLFYVKKIFHIGSPAALGQFSSALGFFALMTIISTLPNSTVPIAAYGVGDRIIEFGFIIIMGLDMGMATIVGHSLGASKFSRAKEAFRTAVKLSFVLLAIMTVIIAAFGEELVAFFIPRSPEVIKEGGRFLLIFGFGIPFFGVFSAVEGLYQGAGRTFPILVMGLSRLWLFRVLMVYLLGIALSMGTTGVWVGMALSNVLAAGVAMYYYFKGDWKHRVIEEE